jgi:hypothetical protein
VSLSVYTTVSIADTVVIKPTDGKDAYIDEEYPDNNYNTGEIVVWPCDVGRETRGLIEFEDLSAIPDGVEITKATLRLFLVGLWGQHEGVWSHRITSPWSETGVTWNTQDGATPWNTPGGDYDPTPSDFVPNEGIVDWKEWDVTQFVQGWIEGRFPNYGIILIGKPAGLNDGISFASSESVFGDDWDPELVVEYTPAELTVDIDVNGDVFTTDDNLIITVEANNPGDEITKDVRIWVGLPDGSTARLIKIDDLPIPNGILGPFEIVNYIFDGSDQEGEYEAGIRLLHPDTGETTQMDVESFVFELPPGSL